MFTVYDIVSRVLYKVYGLCASVAEVLCESAIAKLAVSVGLVKSAGSCV